MTRYQLHPACRVRKETFGLLFYDLRGPRLLFAETADLLDPDLLRDGGAPATALAQQPPVVQARVGRLLERLVEKGFLREQPVC